MKALSLSFVLTFIVISAAHAEESVRYATHIKPIFDRNCSSCHGGLAPEHGDFKKDKQRYKQMFVGPKMDSYAHLIQFIGWPDSGALMRRLDDGKNTKNGKPGNMYHHLGANEKDRQENLQFFKAWVGNWTLKRFSEFTQKDLEEIKVEY